MPLLYINFGYRNPPYPALGSNIPSARRPGQRFHFLQCRGSSPSLRFVNRHGGTLRRAGWVDFTADFTKVTDIAFTSDFCNNYSCPASPASLYLTSPRPILDVLKSLVSRRQVPSPHTRVPMSPSHFCTHPSSRHELILVTYGSIIDPALKDLKILKHIRTFPISLQKGQHFLE